MTILCLVSIVVAVSVTARSTGTPTPTPTLNSPGLEFCPHKVKQIARVFNSSSTPCGKRNGVYVQIYSLAARGILTVDWTGVPQVEIMKWSEKKSPKANGTLLLVRQKGDRRITGETSLGHPCSRPAMFLVADGTVLKSTSRASMKEWRLKNESSESNRIRRKYPGETVYSLRMDVEDPSSGNSGNLNLTYCLAASSSTGVGVELTDGNCSDNRFLFTFCEDQPLIVGNDYTDRYSECWWNFPSWLSAS